MAMELTSYDLHHWIKQNKQWLEGAKIEKIWQVNDTIIMRLYKQGEKQNLYISPSIILLSKKEVEKPLYPPSFVMRLRKFIQGRKIEGISMQELDRVVEISIKPSYKLIAEMLHTRGNILLLENNKILAVMHPKNLKDRQLKIHKDYQEMAHPHNILKTTKQDFISILREQEEEIITRKIIKSFGIPKKIVLEKEQECGIEEKQLIKQVQDKNLECLYEKLKNAYEQDLKEEINSKIEQEFFAEIEEAQKKDHEPVKTKIPSSKKQSIENAIKKLQQEIENIQKTAELISMHTAYLEELLSNPEKLKSYSLDKKNKTITLELEGKEVVLRYDLNIYQNLNLIYQRIKKYKARIQELEKKMQKIEQEQEKSNNQSNKPRVLQQQSKPKQWYEKFRWFKTTNGFLCVAAKDATTNEILIKKHMEKDDLVFHTLEPGSPFALLKNARDKAQEQDILECAQFLICYSKLWKAEVAMGEVFYVYPEQVSKEAPSGEYMGKGMFMIRGKRNILKMPLELAVAYHEGKIEVAPFVKHATNKARVAIVPGSTRGKELIKQIKEKLKNKVKKEVLEDLDEQYILAHIPYNKGHVR
ncbi:MAG: fibronectin-binding domain-containing protein [Candidatus Nanohaloarchaeota archaeon]|nr:fibronectin-binding domain-containing protein [Candidatus Nanohaloarchaeota archaeon]